MVGREGVVIECLLLVLVVEVDRHQEYRAVNHHHDALVALPEQRKAAERLTEVGRHRDALIHVVGLIADGAIRRGSMQDSEVERCTALSNNEFVVHVSNLSKCWLRKGP